MNKKLTVHLRNILRFQEFGVGSALVIICLALGFSTKHFFDTTNLLSVLRQSVYIGIMSLGMVFVLSGRDVDLSIGSIYNLSGIVTAFLMFNGFPVFVSVIIGIALGMACGMFNVFVSILTKIPTIIVSLGTMGIYKGFGLVICKSQAIYDFNTENFFFRVIGTSLGGIPTGVIILIMLTIFFSIVYNRTIFGTRVKAIGSNPEAARFSGINIAKFRIFIFMILGGLAAIAGILEVSFLQLSNPSMGSGTELIVIAATIIGGTTLSGGSGSIFGALIGTIIIMVVRNGIVHLNVSPYWSSTVTGSVIICAVAIDYLFKRGKRK